ncbi:MAG: terminase small subunit [Alphaproteobacteria bacterium]
MAELNERQEMFCREYVRQGVGSWAAVAAGYERSGAAVQASRLLDRPEVQARIAERRVQVAGQHARDTDALLARLEAICEMAIRREQLHAAVRVVTLQARLAGLMPERGAGRAAAKPAPADGWGPEELAAKIRAETERAFPSAGAGDRARPAWQAAVSEPAEPAETVAAEPEVTEPATGETGTAEPVAAETAETEMPVTETPVGETGPAEDPDPVVGTVPADNAAPLPALSRDRDGWLRDAEYSRRKLANMAAMLSDVNRCISSRDFPDGTPRPRGPGDGDGLEAVTQEPKLEG